jgi:cell division protein FtsI/penicillin-binding protein 2
LTRPSTAGELIEIQPKDRKRFKKLLDESKNFESDPDPYAPDRRRGGALAANRYRFPGVEVKARLFRQYPLGPWFARHRLHQPDQPTATSNHRSPRPSRTPTTRAPTTSARPASSSATSSTAR